MHRHARRRPRSLAYVARHLFRYCSRGGHLGYRRCGALARALGRRSGSPDPRGHDIRLRDSRDTRAYVVILKFYRKRNCFI